MDRYLHVQRPENKNNIACAACKQAIISKNCMICSECKETYHPICVNAVSSDASNATEWKCPTCRASEPKSGNLNTPALVTDRLESPTTNTPGGRAHKRPALRSPDLTGEGGEHTLQGIASELRYLRLDMAEIKSCLKLLTESITTCNNRMDSLESRIHLLEEKDNIIYSLKEEVLQLQEQINYQTQTTLNKELEIIGVNESLNENLEHIAMVAATKIGVNLPESEIDCVNRAGPNNVKNNGKDNFPRPIIVKLIRKTKRDELVKAAKARRHSFTTADLDLPGPSRKIYINEHLSKHNRLLFREARVRAKDSGYRFCWVRNGRVHLRKEEGKPAISIISYSDLDRCLPPRTSEDQIPVPNATN